MSNEERELNRARALLAQFESDMGEPKGVAHLAEGLWLLAEIRANSESETIKQTASNLSLTYAKKVNARVELFLSLDPPAHWEIFEHWHNVFQEFENSGFVFSQEMSETRSRLSWRLWETKANAVFRSIFS